MAMEAMVDDTRVLSKPLAYGLLGFGLLFSAITFSLLMFSGTKPPHFSPAATLFLYFACIVVMPILNILATRLPAFKLPAIIWIHITLMTMLVFYNEPLGPFTGLWTLMILLASLYYGWAGFVGSCLSLAIATLTYIVLFRDSFIPNPLTPTPLVYTLVAVMVNVFTFLTAYVFMRVIVNSRKKNRDLTSAQNSELLQVNRLNTLLNSISDAVLTLNRYGRITSQNAAAQAFFDTNQSLIGRDISTLLSPVDQSDAPVSMHELIESVKSTTLRDDLSITNDGETQHISLQMSRIRGTFDHDEEYGVVLIIRDITKQKTLEEEKDEFISVASHELRTPVAIAEGSLSNLLVMYKKQSDPQKLEEASKTAYDQIIYLSKIINDLSTLSRAERGAGDDVEEIDVGAMLHDLYGRYEKEAADKSLHLNLEIDGGLPHVETSRLYLEEIIQNLISNALKYTKQGSITIRASMLPDGRVRCEVQDTGIGISRHDQEHIFEKFYRSEDYRTRETSGTGLGLYVVRKLADKLETQIEVDSRLNHGSTFGFVLPLKSKSLDSTTAPKAKPAKKSADTAPVATPVVQ
jgi:two-component system phosphate regulon sensor histidine kinase PhoR